MKLLVYRKTENLEVKNGNGDGEDFFIDVEYNTYNTLEDVIKDVRNKFLTSKKDTYSPNYFIETKSGYFRGQHTACKNKDHVFYKGDPEAFDCQFELYADDICGLIDYIHDHMTSIDDHTDCEIA